MIAADTPFRTTKTLSQHELFRVRATRPVTIDCESGELWVTEDGHPEDQILVAGKRYTTRGTAPVLIEALVDSRVRVAAAVAVAAPCWSLAAMFDKARLGLGFARVNTGGLITSAMTGRVDAWRSLRDSGCA